MTHGELVNYDFYMSLYNYDMAATSSEKFKMVEIPSDEVQNSSVKNECNMKDETLREYLSGALRMLEQGPTATGEGAILEDRQFWRRYKR